MADRPGLVAALPYLLCPFCQLTLGLTSGSLGCQQGHRFDIARQGYVSLLGPRSRTDTGDNTVMVAARSEFLAAGHYRPIATAVAAVVGPSAELLVEVGAGTGYYLGSALDTAAAAVGIAVDSSARAARRAATAHPRMAAVVADAWDRLPVADGRVDAVLSVFAPRQVPEFCRLLAPSGRIVVVTPEPDHLAELIGPFGMLRVDRAKAAGVAQSFAPELAVARNEPVRFVMSLTPGEARALVLMGPTARHLVTADFERHVAGLPRLTTVTASVTVTVLSRPSPPTARP